MKKPLKWALTCLLFVFQAVPGVAQDNASVTFPDTSRAHLEELRNLQDFYLSQVRKDNVPDPVKEVYRQRLQQMEEEINTITDARLKAAEQAGSDVYKDEIAGEEFRRIALDLKAMDIPVFYAHEPNVWQVQAGSFFGGKRYLWPLLLRMERSFGENYSAGIYAAHFIERSRTRRLYPEKEPYYYANIDHYNYRYFSFGVTGTHHFIAGGKTIAGLNPSLFDLYVSVTAGINVASAEKPVLLSGGYEPATKSGFNYGAMAGFKYMPDYRLGYFLEAGYSRNAFVNAGFCFRLIKKPEMPAGSGQPVIGEMEPAVISDADRKMNPASYEAVGIVNEEAIKEALAAALEEQRRKAQEDSVKAAGEAVRKAQEDSLMAARKAMEELQKTNTVSNDSLQMVARALEEESAKTPVHTPVKEEGIVFRIQLFAVSKKLALNDSAFNGIPDIYEYEDGGLYKYTVGNTKKLDEAYVLLADLRKRGFADAFVAVFNNRKRIPVQEALRIIRQRKK